MTQASINFPENTFFFHPNSRDYVEGKISKLTDQPTLKRAITFSLQIALMIGLPISLIFAGFITLISDQSLLSTFTLSAVCMIFSSAYIGFQGYRNGRKIHSEGKLAVGEVTRHQVTIGSSFRKGYRKATRMHFEFIDDTGETRKGFIIVSLDGKHIFDGRELPEIGTPIIIKYLDKNWKVPI